MATIQSSSFADSALAQLDPAQLEERIQLSLRLIDAVLDAVNEHDDLLVRRLVEEEHCECWVQDQQGWTALHAAACTYSLSTVRRVLERT